MFVLGVCACGHPTPKALEEARKTFERAKTGPAKNAASAELFEAERTLAQAEASFRRGAHPRITDDLAYIAERQAQLAEARAGSVLADRRTEEAGDEVDALERERAEREARRSLCR
jgi:hypothetical protein